MMGYVKLVGLAIAFLLLVGLTIIAASNPTIPALLGLLAVYFLTGLIVERSMQSFVGLTKPRLLTRNFTTEEMRETMAQLLAMAERSIKIVSGRMRADVWGDLRVITALRDVIGRKVVIEIITEEEIDPVVKPFIESLAKEAKKGKIILYRLYEHRVSRHFVIVDDLDVRIEGKHEPAETDIKARYWYSFKRLGGQVKRKFEEIKKEAIRVTFI